MRNRSLIVVAVPIAIAAAACGHNSRAVSANEVDLQRDLKLASTTTMNLATPQVNPANFDALETQPESAPRQSAHLVKARGPKALASNAPDLKASRIPQVAANQTVPQVQTVAAAPAPIPNQDPVATAPRPGSAPTEPGFGAGAGNQGRAGSGSGGFGPILGAVIRGGEVGGDNCEPHGGRGRFPGVYIPMPGGMGGSRFPVVRPGGVIFH